MISGDQVVADMLTFHFHDATLIDYMLPLITILTHIPQLYHIPPVLKLALPVEYRTYLKTHGYHDYGIY